MLFLVLSHSESVFEIHKTNMEPTYLTAPQLAGDIITGEIDTTKNGQVHLSGILWTLMMEIIAKDAEGFYTHHQSAAELRLEPVIR